MRITHRKLTAMSEERFPATCHGGFAGRLVFKNQRVSSAPQFTPHEFANVVAADSVSPHQRRSPTIDAASARFAQRTELPEEMLKALAC
jgi:hypothetical protein